MSDCCTPKGYEFMFSERRARTEASRYRRRGLDGPSRRIVDYLKKLGVDGRTVLEVGGGIGAVQIELLKAGAARATSIELTPTYERVASELLAEAGLADRVQRRVMDFAQESQTVGVADVVIMNRVVCCYPDMPLLTGAAADHAGQVLVMTFPKGNWWSRAGFGALNLMLRVTRREFHAFVHRPSDIIATSRAHGLRLAYDDSGVLWSLAALSRAT